MPELEEFDFEKLKELHALARENDRKAKERMKKEYDQRIGAREPQIQVGLKVLLKMEQKGKSNPRWDLQPYTITAIKGTMCTAKRGDQVVTRNSSWFKPFYSFNEAEDDATPTQVLAETIEPIRKSQNAPTPMQQTEAQDPSNPQANTEDQGPKRRRGRPTREEAQRMAQERVQMEGDGMIAERMTPGDPRGSSQRLSLKSGERCGVQTTR